MKFPLLAVLTTASSLVAAPLPDGASKAWPDLVYVTRDTGPQRMDLYLPEGPGPHPVVLYVHGGAWRGGDRLGSFAFFLLKDGYAVASIDYRLTDKGPFPAQIQDCKAAVRYLREHAREFHLDPDRIAAMGDSAGGHLVSLLGVASDVPALTDAPNSPTSESVKAVVDFYGPSDLTVISPDWVRTNKDDLLEAVSLLLGGPYMERQAEAQAASPITYIDANDPPFLILQGETDDVVPPSQSKILHAALEKAGVPNELILLPGMGHGGPDFGAEPQRRKIREFLAQTLGS